MPEPKRLQIFISSPSDVEPERVVAERVVARLDRQFSAHATLQSVRWERKPLRATSHFQKQIPSAADADIVVVILWWHLGTPLPEHMRGAISGNVVSGTEFEFEEAVKSYFERTTPDVFVYHKVAIPSFQDEQQIEQYPAARDRVRRFFLRWFEDAKDGSLKAAWRTFRTTTEFEELLDQHLVEVLRRRLAEPRRALALEHCNWHEGSPFRGLEPFETQHAPIFFGRSRARHELRETLVRQVGHERPWVIVLGPSGSGKSSLVKAGFIPDITTPGMIEGVGLCRVAVMRPSDANGDLLAALSLSLLSSTALPELARLKYDATRLEQLLAADGGQARLPIEQGLTVAHDTERLLPHAHARLMIVIDQLEEAFTADPKQSRLSTLLCTLDALAASGLVWIVATMRSDFLGALEAHPDLADRFDGTARYFVSPLTEPELRQVINRPAEVSGLSFSVDVDNGAGLDEAITGAARDAPGSLPLLEYLLDQLWQRRNARGELTWEAYRAVGGLEGAIASRAEAVFRALPVEAREALPKVLRALVTVVAPEDEARPTAQWVDQRLFPDGSAPRTLVTAMLAPDARLLVADEEGRVRVAHEAVLSHWPRAVEQIRADISDLKVWARLRAHLNRWASASEEHQPSLLLPPGLPLMEAEDLLARRADELDESLVSYVEASRAADQQRLQVERHQQARLRDAVRMAAVRQLYRDPAKRAALLREFEDPTHALGWMAIASETIFNPVYHAALLPPWGEKYDHLALNRDGSILVALGHSVGTTIAIVWRVGWIGQPVTWTSGSAWIAEDGHVGSEALGSEPPTGSHYRLPAYLRLAFDSEDRLLVLSGDTTLDVMRLGAFVDLREHGRLDTVEHNHEGVSSVRQQIKVLGTDSYTPATPTPPGVAVGCSRNGRHIVILYQGGTLVVRHLEGLLQERRVRVEDVNLARLLTVSDDGDSIALLDPRSAWAQLVQLNGPAPAARTLGKDVLAVDVSPDGSCVVVAHKTGPVRVLRASDLSLLMELDTAHHRPGPLATAVAFMPCAHRVVICHADGDVYLLSFDPTHSQGVLRQDFWVDEIGPIETGFRRRTRRSTLPVLYHHHGVRRIVTSPDGRTVVTIADDGSAVLAGLDGATGPAQLRVGDERIIDAAFSRDGRWVATVSDTTGPRIWDVSSSTVPTTISSTSTSRNGIHRLAVETTAVEEFLWTQCGDGFRRSRIQGADPVELFDFLFWGLDGGATGRQHTDPNLRWTCCQLDGEPARVFPIQSGRSPFTLHNVTEEIRVAVSPDQRWAAGITIAGVALLWDVVHSEGPRTLDVKGAQMSAAAFSPDSRLLAMGTLGGTVLVSSANSHGTLRRLGDLGEPIKQLDFNADGTCILAEGVHGRALLASLLDGTVIDCGVALGARFIDGSQTVMTIRSDTAVEMAADGSWHVRRFLPQGLGKLELIGPNGRWILLRPVQSDGRVLLLSIVEATEPIPLGSPTAAVTAAATNTAGTRVITGHADGTVRIWPTDLSSESMIKRLWRATADCLSIDERRSFLAEDLVTARKHRAADLATAYRYHAESLAAKVLPQT